MSLRVSRTITIRMWLLIVLVPIFQNMTCYCCVYDDLNIIHVHNYFHIHQSIIFQTDNFSFQGMGSVFTLWNTYTGREIRRVTSLFESIILYSPLQPGQEGDCVSMLLLFGRMPSWYNLPCSSVTTRSVICKRLIEYHRPTPYHISSNKHYTKCHSGDLFADQRCFSINWDIKSLSGIQRPFILTYIVERYFINLFSLITEITLQNHSVIFGSPTSDTNKDNCFVIGLPNYTPFEYQRNIFVHRSRCHRSNISKVFHVVPTNYHHHVRCTVNQFHCNDGTCISQYNLCQRHPKCERSLCVCHIDGHMFSGVYECIISCNPVNCRCPLHHFQCSTGGCIQMALVCDGKPDCSDASDEMCALGTMRQSTSIAMDEILIGDTKFCLAFRCQSLKCVPLKYVNDLVPDCPGGLAEDESLFIRLRNNGERSNCLDQSHFPCVPGLPVCFPIEKVCHYEIDQEGNVLWCRNGAHLGKCADIYCTNGYKCPKSYCIPFHRVCDGHPDCIHHEDEQQCDQHLCKGLLKCYKSKICVHPSQVCDGIKHCPGADDEKLCDTGFCPRGCDCLSYSFICSSKFPNTFPLTNSGSIKHISIIKSDMSHPNFMNICNQRELIFLNLSGNELQNICDSFYSGCGFQDNIRILDISHNRITFLKRFCFNLLSSLRVISLANNPLHILVKHLFVLPWISYINIHGTQVKMLTKESLAGLDKVHTLDIRETRVNFIDSHAENILLEIPDLLFNDLRLCCIFKQNNYCITALKMTSPCIKILPHYTLSYNILTTGAILILFNVAALCANCKQAHDNEFTRLVSFVISVDAILAAYFPFISIADIYYGAHFVLSVTQWQQSAICVSVEILSATTIMVSITFSGVLVLLTARGVTHLGMNNSGIWYKISCGKFMFVIIATLCNVSLTLIRTFMGNSINRDIKVCNPMGYSKWVSWTDMIITLTLVILMVSLLSGITVCAIRVIMYVSRAGKAVREIISKRDKSKQGRASVYRSMIVLVVVKAMTLLPYPALLFMSVVYDDIPNDAYVYVMVNFIMMESLFNPVLFVWTPLITKMRQQKNWMDTRVPSQYKYRLFQVWDSHVKDRMVARDGDPYTGETYLYWDGAQFVTKYTCTRAVLLNYAYMLSDTSLINCMWMLLARKASGTGALITWS